MPARKSELFEDLERGENPLVVRQPEDFQKLLDFVFVQQPPLPAPLKRYLGERAVAASAFNAQIFEQLRQRYIPLEPELPKIEAPTLLLWGDRDRVLDVSSIEVMRPLLKRPSVVIMENCGHVPMVERPEETAQHYQAFLDGVRNAQVAGRCANRRLGAGSGSGTVARRLGSRHQAWIRLAICTSGLTSCS